MEQSYPRDYRRGQDPNCHCCSRALWVEDILRRATHRLGDAIAKLLRVIAHTTQRRQ